MAAGSGGLGRAKATLLAFQQSPSTQIDRICCKKLLSPTVDATDRIIRVMTGAVFLIAVACSLKSGGIPHAQSWRRVCFEEYVTKDSPV